MDPATLEEINILNVAVTGFIVFYGKPEDRMAKCETQNAQVQLTEICHLCGRKACSRRFYWLSSALDPRILS